LIKNITTNGQELTEQNYFEFSEAKNWWRYFFENDKERIWLSNFSHQATFNLINKKKEQKR